MKKLLASLLIAAMSCTLLTGCGSGKGSASAGGTKLFLSYTTDDFRQAFADAASAEAQAQGVTITLSPNDATVEEQVASIKKAVADGATAILCIPANASTAQELEDRWPDLTPKERENRIAQENGTVFIQGIGGKLRSGKPHDGRAPDYDDWELNGDILFWYPVLNCSMEISSMGIRVSPESLDRQLTLAGCDNRRELPFHKMLLQDRLPLTMGGGIGQSRLCMLLLGKAHIGEVQSSIWDEETMKLFEAADITLL